MVREFGRNATVVNCNVVSKPQVQAAADHCVAELGKIDLAVANAGIGRGGSILEIELKDWQDQVDINLTGVVLTVQAAAQRMVAAGNGGRIVCISSLAAISTNEFMWGYSATKVGVRMMVRGWAQDLGPHGITVNAIGPGVIDTPLAHGLAGDEGRDRGELLRGLGSNFGASQVPVGLVDLASEGLSSGLELVVEAPEVGLATIDVLLDRDLCVEHQPLCQSGGGALE